MFNAACGCLPCPYSIQTSSMAEYIFNAHAHSGFSWFIYSWLLLSRGLSYWERENAIWNISVFSVW